MMIGAVFIYLVLLSGNQAELLLPAEASLPGTSFLLPLLPPLDR